MKTKQTLLKTLGILNLHKTFTPIHPPQGFLMGKERIMNTLQFLKMLKKKSPDVSFYTSHQVPKGKCYDFTYAKGSDDAIKVFKHDQGVHIGYCVAVTFWLAIIGSVTLVNYTWKGFRWIVEDVYRKDD